MPAAIPTCEPSSIVAGDTVTFTKALRDYAPSDGWSLVYALRGPVTGDATVTAQSATNDYLVTFSATVTETLTPGSYLLVGVVSKAGERYTVYSRRILVSANPLDADDGDFAIADETLLAAIDARIQNRVLDSGADISSYTIGGRSITRIPMPELLTFRGIVAARVWKQRNPGQASPQIAGGFSRAR